VNTAIDLDRYFLRIGYKGPRTPTLDTLRAIHALHPASIVFENLDPWLRRPFGLDAASIEGKLVRAGRGGYCFEHNLLLGHALKALGFRVKGLGARPLWRRLEGAVTPREHMLLLVDVAGQPHIADVGFGGMTVTAPLRLDPDTEQATPHELFRVLKVDAEFVLQAKIHSQWAPVYRFDLQEQLQPDYEIANWYHSTHPGSQFINDLIVARPMPGRRYALRNNQLAIHHTEGATERRVLRTVATLRDALTGTFGIVLPDGPDLDDALRRLPGIEA
jgi:N-hydroxyarylamine O-acetyltransferase